VNCISMQEHSHALARGSGKEWIIQPSRRIIFTLQSVLRYGHTGRYILLTGMDERKHIPRRLGAGNARAFARSARWPTRNEISRLVCERSPRHPSMTLWHLRRWLVEIIIALSAGCCNARNYAQSAGAKCTLLIGVSASVSFSRDADLSALAMRIRIAALFCIARAS